MKKSKLTAWAMAITLILAPGAAAYADDTGTTTPPPASDSGTITPPPAPDSGDTGTITPPPASDSGTVTPPPPPDSGDGGTVPPPPPPDNGDGGAVCTQIPDTGDNGGTTTQPPASPSTPAPKMSDRNGFQDFFKGRNGHGNEEKNGDHNRRDDQQGGPITCTKQDNGQHRGWTKKIENMLKLLNQMKREAESLQKHMERLKEWAKTNGSANDLDALKQILEALDAKDQAGEADNNDLMVLAETQDQLNDTAGSVQTLERALTTNYNDDNVYKLLSAKLVKSGQKGIKVYVQGKKPKFDVQPIVVQGRTMVPFRAIGDSLQAKVQWDAATQTINLNGKDGKVVKLQIGNKQATVDGKPVTLEVPATVVNGRTLVPLRALGDIFNLKVNWDDAAKMAFLK